MNCKNVFCIFNHKEKCIFKKVSLNQVGSCNNMRLLNNQQFDFDKATEKIRNYFNLSKEKNITDCYKKYLDSKNKKTSC